MLLNGEERMKLWISIPTLIFVGIVLASPGAFAQRSPDNHSQQVLKPLACSPAPCVLRNVLTSPNLATSTIVAANPKNMKQFLAGSQEQGCAFASGSVNGGSSWYFGNLGCVEGGSPTLAYGVKGTAYLAAGYDAVELTTTQDNGNTWSPAAEVVSPFFNGGSALAPWLAVDNTKGSPYQNRLYIAATQRDAGQVQSQISVSYSDDGGDTWIITAVDKIQTEPNLDQFSRIAIGSDGSVYIAWQRCAMSGRKINCGGTMAHMLFSKSSDGGSTWSTPLHMAVVRLVPDSCSCAFFGNLPHTYEPVADPPVLAVDNSGGKHAGNLYALMYNWTGKQMQVQVITSRDHGQSWGAPVAVAPASATHDQFFPYLSVSSTGVVGVSWLDRRNDKHNVRYQPFAAYSIDGAASFSDNFALANRLSNPYFSSTYMGDYTGNDWAGSTLYATWPDTRNSLMQDYFGGLRVK
jgi:hypothetical protein